MLTCREDIIKERKAYAESFASQKRKILVCAGTGCIAGGSLDIHAELKRLMAENGLPSPLSFQTTRTSMRNP